jgi:hypothetical protein
VRDFEVKGFSGHGFQNAGGGRNLEFVDNHIHDIGKVCTTTSSGKVGIYLDYGPALIDRNLIHDIGRYADGENGCSTSGNTYYQNHDHGVYVSLDSTSSNVTIRNNIFYRNLRGWSIQIYGGPANGLVVAGNTFADPNPWRNGHIIVADVVTNSLFADNIFYNPTKEAINFCTTSGHSLTLKNNISTNAITTESVSGVASTGNMAGTDPLLTSPTNRDYHLTSGSPAVNTGVAVSGDTTDYNGVTRAAPPSVGAYEWGSTP